MGTVSDTRRGCLIGAMLCSAYPTLADHQHHHYAKVVRSVPVYEDVAHENPRHRCWDETVYYEERRNTAAPLLGAIIGGIIGHNVGHGSRNQALGTFAGAGVGAAVGSHSSRHEGHYHLEQRCETVREVHWQSEVVGYDVTYRYHGKEYTTRLPYDPGDRLKVTVSVEPAD